MIDRHASKSLAERLCRYATAGRDISPLPADVKLCSHKQQPAEVLELAWQRHRAHPADGRVADWLAYLLYTNRRYQEALPLLEALVTAPGATAVQHFHLARCLFALERKESAIDYWELVVRKFPESEVARKAAGSLRYLSLHLVSGPTTRV